MRGSIPPVFGMGKNLGIWMLSLPPTSFTTSFALSEVVPITLLRFIANLQAGRITLLSVAFFFRFEPIPNLDFNFIRLVTAHVAVFSPKRASFDLTRFQAFSAKILSALSSLERFHKFASELYRVSYIFTS